MRNIIRSVKVLYRLYPIFMLLLGILTVVSLFISPLSSLIDKYLFDTLQQGYDSSLEWDKVLFIVFIYFFYNLFIFVLFKFNDILNTYTQTKVNATFQRLTVDKISKIEYDQFENNDYYNYITTVLKEVNGGNVLGIYVNTLVLISVIATTTYLSVLLIRLSIWAVLISILCCIPGFLHQASFSKKNWEFNTTKIPLLRKTSYYFSLLSSIGTYRENRIYNTMLNYKQKYNEYFDHYYNELKDFNLKNCWKGILMSTLHAMGTVSVITYAYFQAANGNITLGDAVLFVGVSQSIYNNIQRALYTFGAINESKHSINNILDLLLTSRAEIKKIEEKKEVEDSVNNLAVELFNITYAYPGVEQPVLNGLNLNIKQGEKLAIVGENGSGKTTLVKIILGLYHPSKGIVKINGLDLKSSSNQFRYGSVCFQDYFTYSLSIRENVAFGDISKISDNKKINSAIEMSELEYTSFHNDINSQVTKLFDSNGVVLSGGQSQKLSLARAFMYDHGLIVLDEPSASLDVKTENEIFELVLKLMQGRTSIIITHRLSNVIHCDRIVYLESGIIYEEGTHAELMKKGGKYAELYSIQAKKYML